MGRLVTLEELEAYRQEVLHAQREGRVPRYRDPREVFNEDPNREEGFLVELSESELEQLEADRQKAYEETQAVKEQVIQEIQDNGNVIYSDSVLPASASPDEHTVTTPDLTEEQATQLYENSQPNDNEVTPLPPVGALNNPAQSPSIAPEESVVPVPGTVEGAPEPMQSIVEAAALQGNNTESQHQNLVSTPNPEPVTPSTQPAETENTTPAPELPTLNEPIVEPGTQQFQPEAGSNAGPTVPGAETIQTPSLSNEAAVPSEPANGSTTDATNIPSADTSNTTSQPGTGTTSENTNTTDTQVAPPTSE